MNMITKYKVLIWCFIFSIIFLLPQLVQTQPNLLDIAETWSFGRFDNQKVIQEFSNPERFRPIYVITRMVLNTFANYHNQYYFLILSVFLSFTLYLVLFIQKDKKWFIPIIILTIVLFYISPVSIDTYWRLGTAENIFTLILCICVYGLIKKKYTVLTCAVLSLMMAKETAVFYIPVFIFFLLYKKRWIELSIISVGYIWYLNHLYSLIQIIRLIPKSYSSIYSISAQSMSDMFQHYMTTQIYYMSLFIMSIVLLCNRIIQKHKPMKFSEWENEICIILIILMGIFSLLIFPNKYQPYYFFPSMTMTLLYVGWEMSRVSHKIINIFLIYVGLLFVLSQNPNFAFVRAEYWHTRYVGDGVLVEEMMKNAHTRTYSFDRFYRPEYDNVLDYINECMKTSLIKSCNRFQISQIIEGEQNEGSIPLCGTSVIGKQICSWSIKQEILETH
jgi:hypothetical protein